MKILAFGASNSKASINRMLATHAANIAREEIDPEAEIEVLDLNEFEMPIYSIDRENQTGVPELAQAFLDRITSAHILIISYAEHNGSYTAAYKNIFDWASRIEKQVYQNKPALILSTSPGKRGGAGVLAAAANSLGFFGADIRASLSIPQFNEHFDRERGELMDPDYAAQLRDAVRKLRN